MKAKINYRSKKTIIIISVAVVLLIAAIVGTVAFVKGNQDAAAAMTDDGTSTSQNDGANAGLPNNGGQNNGDDQNNNGTTLPEVGDNTNPADSNNNGNNGSTTNGGTTGTNGANGSNTGANAGTTTGTTTTGNNGANVPNQDYTQTTVIPGRDNVLVEQNTEIGWSPISVAAYTAVSKLKVHKPDLDLQKYAYLDGDSLEELPVNTVVQKGETINYVIKITNKGNEDANGIRTIDSIPEGTELASISEGGALNNDGKIVWKNNIKAGETVAVSFKVKVTADSIDLINNIAKVNGEETPETKTPVITANKTAQVVTIVDKEEVLENRDAKVGETIRYTITAKNTTEVDGTTVIKDIIPDGTTFVDGSIKGNGNFDKENGTITWNNVVVPAKGEVSVSFDVVVNKTTKIGEEVVDVKSVSNTATVGNTPTEEVETKVANITGEKKVSSDVANVGDTLTYTIILTNNGNGDGKVTVTDKIPEGTKIKVATTDGYDLATNTMTWKNVEVKAGKSVELTLEVVVEDNTSVIKNKAYVDDNKIPEEPETAVKHHYTVEHYTENLDGTYSKVEKDTVVSEDVEIGTKVTYENNNYEGFIFDDSKTENKDATVPDNNNLVVKLYYTRRNDLSYTVYYKEQGTENELAYAKVVDGKTFGDVVTENAIDIDGYNKVNPTSGNITITTGTNEYTFYYTKRNDLSYTVYYKEQGTEKDLADAKVVDGQIYGNTVTENAIDIDGYNKVNPTSGNITITTGTNEYTFYYTKRNDLSYIVNYLEKDSNEVLHEAKTVGNQTFGKVIKSLDEVISIDGYNYDSADKETLTIGTSANVINIYYTKRTDLSYTVNYYYNGKLEISEYFDNQEYMDDISRVDPKPEYNGVTYTKYDLKTSSSNGLLPLIIGTGSNYINVYYGTPNVTISKNVNKTAVKVGDTLHYTIKVTETRGLVDASGINVTDPIPEGLENVRNITHNGNINEGNVEWNNLTITKNSSITLEFDATVSATTIGKTISNTAKLGGSASGESTVKTEVAEIQALTHELTPGQTGKDAANIVLVMDLSSSMNEKIKEFTACTHERKTQKHWNPWDGEWTEEYCPEGCKKQDDGTWGKWQDTEVTRLAAAKEAAQNFVKNVYAKANASAPDSKATVTVITFNEKTGDTKYVGTKVLTFGENYAYTTATASNYNDLVTEIGHIDIGTKTTGYGTHMRAALDKTYNTIYDATNGIAKNYPNNSNYVIFLGDGEPTPTNYSGFRDNDVDSIYKSAQKIKSKGVPIYSIGFGEDVSDKNSTGYQVLQGISSENKVYTANDSIKLTEIFKNLAGGMTDKPNSTKGGKIVVTPTNELYFNTADGKQEYITLKYNGETLIECKSQEELNNNAYLTYVDGKLTFDINAWNSVDSNKKITTGGENLVLSYYIVRAD